MQLPSKLLGSAAVFIEVVIRMNDNMKQNKKAYGQQLVMLQIYIRSVGQKRAIQLC
jgi:hypothetical protein